MVWQVLIRRSGQLELQRKLHRRNPVENEKNATLEQRIEILNCQCVPGKW